MRQLSLRLKLSISQVFRFISEMENGLSFSESEQLTAPKTDDAIIQHFRLENQEMPFYRQGSETGLEEPDFGKLI